ncbi:MAG: DUF4843 domain-containing protein [Flavisolibacter sp.]
MRKKIIFIQSLIVFFLAACKQEVPTLFNQPDAIYFNTTDSLQYTFAKYPSRTVDTMRLPVMVLGNPVNADREISLENLSGPDLGAREGVHFKLLPPYTMPANKVSTVLPVAIYRTSDLDSINASFKIQLKANKNFTSGITSKMTVKVKLGFLQKPASWGEINGIQWAGYSSNLGTWTKTKYKLVLDALYDTVSDTTVSEFPFSRFGPPAIYTQYLQLVKNYIRTNYPGNYSTPLGIGPTLRDPDANNAVIQVGPANY